MEEPVARCDLALPPGWKLLAFETVGSTNDEAMQRADREAAEGTVVWAKRQVKGRGCAGCATGSGSETTLIVFCLAVLVLRRRRR